MRFIGRTALLAAVAWVFVWSAQGVRIDWDRVSRGLPAIGRIVKLMFPLQVEGSALLLLIGAGVGAISIGWWEVKRRRTPYAGIIIGAGVLLGLLANREWLWPSVSAMGQSLAIALIGTSIGAVLAIPLGFWAARNVVVYEVLAALGRQVLNAVRTFPELVLAVFFVASYGPGPLAGAMAIGIHSVGMLGKLYADIIENIDKGPMEALESAGGSTVQKLFFAVVPQVLPEFIATALYRFEINLRAATTLGLVGAGGVGVILLQALSFRRWGVVGTTLFVIVIVVTAIDYASGALRRKII